MDKHEEIAKRIATEIFYLPATNGKAEASIQHGTELILKAMQEACREQPLREAGREFKQLLKYYVTNFALTLQPKENVRSAYANYEEWNQISIEKLMIIARTALAGEGDGCEHEWRCGAERGHLICTKCNKSNY